MAKYILQVGKHHVRSPETGVVRTYTKGEVVDLTTDQIKAFGDKFKSFEVVQAEVRVQEAIIKAELSEKEAIKADAEKAQKDADDAIAVESAQAQAIVDSANKAAADAEVARQASIKAAAPVIKPAAK